MAGSSTADTAFYFDLASPLAYLTAERILHTLTQPTQWQPVLASELPASEPFQALRCEQEALALRENVERQALALGLQPIRWPADFPFDSEQAMLIATYAKSIGRTVPFAQAAFRQAFAGGRSLAQLDNVLIAAAACEMHPKAVLKAAGLAAIKGALREATAAAAQAGVSDVPAVRIGKRVFAGEDALALAAAV
jgi:2-hydroxychromene-2-carboxylate isomerase